MTTTLEEVMPENRIEDGQETEEHIAPPIGEEEQDRLNQVANRVRLKYKGLRVSVSGIPTSRKVTLTQKQRAADAFGAEVDSLSLSSLLWNAKEPAVKDLRGVIASISRVFHDRTMTLPTTTDGLRMVKKDCVGQINQQLKRLKGLLVEKAELLQYAMPQIIERSRTHRRDLFNEEDYNFDPTKCVGLSWHFPAVTEDTELAELDDQVYQDEVQRVREEMRGVVLRAEEQMAEDMVKMLDAITERLSGVEESGKRKGKPKMFKDHTVNKLFEELDLMSSQLRETGIGGEALATAARRISSTLKGQTADTLPDMLRNNGAYRDHVRDKCEKIAKQLLDQAVSEPRRRVLRKS